MLARSGGYALVIGADLYSRILDPADRRTVVLFGDGAGAMVVGPATRGTARAAAFHSGDLVLLAVSAAAWRPASP